MPPVKSAFVPRFVFSPSSSQRDEPGLDQAQSQIDKRGNKKRRKNAAEKTTSLLKVQLAERNNCALVIKKKTKSKRTLGPEARKNKTKINQERQTQSGNPALVDGDVFFFSEASNSQTQNEKEKAKHSVLRTISKMLEENHLIRNRLATLSQVK